MKTTSTRLARIIVALVAAVGLSACSAIKLGYNNLPEVAYWWIDGYVDFDDAQPVRARAELARLQGWHRQQELPRYVDILGRMERLAPASVSPQQACSFVTEIRGRLLQVAEQAEPAVAALAASLTPQQLQHLERKYRSNNEKFRKDWIHASLAEQREQRYEQQLERLESIYGSLEASQRRLLQQGIAQSSFDPQRLLAERLRRQQDLLQTLQRLKEPGIAPAAARQLVAGYVERVERSPDAGYRAWQEELTQENCRTFAALHETTSAAQRDQAVRRLRAYQRDLRELAQQRP